MTPWDSIDTIQDEINHLSHKKLRLYIERSRAIREFGENNTINFMPGEKEFVETVRNIEERLEALWAAKRLVLSELEPSSPLLGLSPTVGSSRRRSWILSTVIKSMK